MLYSDKRITREEWGEMISESAKERGGLHLTALLLMVAGAAIAIMLACGATGAWADEEEEADSFGPITDVSDGVDESSDQESNSQAMTDEEVPAAFPGVAFDKKEMEIKVGSAVLVGFAPEAADAESDDEKRAVWHESWKEAVDSAEIDLSDESGWLKGVDDDDESIDYSAITGIVTQDKEVFELMGEFPEWKVDDEGTEYRWWYGLLGVAKKTGDTELQIVYRDAEGINHVLDECKVHVIDEADVELSDENDDAQDVEASLVSEPEAEAVEASEDQGLESKSSTAVSISTMANSSDSTASTDKSDTSASTNANSSSTGSSTTTGNTSSTNSAYPKEIFKTLQGASLSGSLLANDQNAEKALALLGDSANFHLVIETKTTLDDVPEKALSTLASNNGISVAERLGVKVVDANNTEATVSGMNLTVKIAADNAIKALDPSSVQVWYVAADGTTEKKTAKLNGGYLTFETTHLSDFVVMGKAASSSTGASTSGKTGLPQTGDNMAYLAIVLAFIAGFAASSALNARRRMKE